MRAVAAVLLLAAVCAGQFSGLHALVREEDLEGIRAMVSNGADINDLTTGQGGQTPLMFGCLMGKAEAVKLLLELGADATIPEKDGYTCAHGAGFQGRTEVMKVIVEAGLDPKDRHKDGYQPIHRASWGKSEGHAELIEYLVSVGVKVTTKASNGLNAYDMVTQRHQTESAVSHTVTRLYEEQVARDAVRAKERKEEAKKKKKKQEEERQAEKEAEL